MAGPRKRRGGVKTSAKRGAAGSNKKPRLQQKDSESKNVEDLDDDHDVFFDSDAAEEEEEEAGEADERFNGEDAETADQKRLRLAKAHLERIKALAKEQEEDEEDDFVKGREEDEGRRDSRVADLLKQEQLEESGRAQRKLVERVIKPVAGIEGKYVGRKHRQSVTAICLTEDDTTGFAASKDGMIVEWNVETGSSYKYVFPNKQESTMAVQGRTGAKKQGSKHVLCLAVSSDGRYLASGGYDRALHLWDTRTREHIQTFPGHRGAVSCLAFRQGTQQLMSGSFDRTIKLWSAEDRSYIDTLFGHQSEVLTLDCLRRERLLSAGRDRTLRIWKVPEESQLVFRGHAASMESCCFITNTEFLSGSDDGCVSLWSIMRMKPAFIAKHAHGHLSKPIECSNGDPADKVAPNEIVNGHCNGEVIQEKVMSSGIGGAAEAWVGAVAVCRGSDLAASGAGDGTVRLWALENGNRKLQPLGNLPVQGFVNSLAFASSGRFLLAGVGQEPRMGRWGRNPGVRNGVLMHTISYTS